ncbi:unnamed protein product [Ectocarpus sp. CCAP 1310/34]|nr:unnamed protein product [Ectocarpus sp. CCAP 1310/34]
MELSAARRPPSLDLAAYNQGVTPNEAQRQDNEVIDLTCTTPPHEVSTATDFRDVKLQDFHIGDRLGATRDGGKGFQGVNSRVFRVRLRSRRHDHASRGRADGANAHPSSVASPSLPSATAGSATKSTRSTETPSSTSPPSGSLVKDLMGMCEQLRKGSFGACLSGNYGSVEQGAANAKRSAVPDKAEDKPADTEWALKMVLTLAAKDPLQAEREMKTEIDVLVGGRIPPHPNIMRGVHSFQDTIGRELQPRLWDGLEPNAGGTLSPHTTFLVMPLFTAGSLQALLNKRRLRCKGPPFLRLLETMRFLKQMLSAISHLLAHGVAHNDIKPDNWLLCADQRTLVLTDFGACFDSSNPPQPRSKPSSSSPAVPVPCLGASAAVSATDLEQTAVTGRGSNPCRSSGAVGSTAAAAAAAAAATTSAASNGTDLSGAGAAEPLANAVTGRKRPMEAGNFVPSRDFGSANRKHLGVSSMPSCDTGTNADSVPGPQDSKRRRLGYRDQERDKVRICSATGTVCSTTEVSDKMVIPFSNYCVAGAPNILAPELARAWEEETPLNFTRSDVFSVGLCMYRMLRPDSVIIDNGTGLEVKDPLEKTKGLTNQEAWPLPIFPENKGGCPFEVSQLCRGLLLADPCKRLAAFEGQSIASNYVSRLEDADGKGQDAMERSVSASGSAGASRPRYQFESPRATGTGEIHGRETRADNALARKHERLGFVENPKSGHFAAVPPIKSHSAVDGMAPPPSPAGGPSNDSCRRDRMLLFRGAGRINCERGGAEGATSNGAAAAGRSSSEERQLPREVDELVKSDRISQMREIFANAAPDNLFKALDTEDWDVAAACAVFGDSTSGDSRPKLDVARASAPGASATESRSGLFFGGVAQELRGLRGLDAWSFRRRSSM